MWPFKKPTDKRQIILKALYDSHSTNNGSWFDLKPLMIGWTKNEMNQVLNELEYKHMFIVCDQTVSVIGASRDFTIPVTMENFKALAFIQPAGEQHYREVYLDAQLKRLQLKWDVLSKPIMVGLTITNVIIAAYSHNTARTSAAASKLLQQEVNMLRIKVEVLKENDKIENSPPQKGKTK